LGERANRKEERHEKEGQEEDEGNIKKWNARKVRLSPPAARKHKKQSGPLTRGRSVIVPEKRLDAKEQKKAVEEPQVRCYASYD
jgi:hypothetical protein